MKKQAAKDLLVKYRNGTCTDQEQAVVEAWYAGWNEGQPALSEQRLVQAEERIYSRLPAKPVAKITSLWPRIAAAASILLLLSAGGYFLLYRPTIQQIAQNQIHNDVLPGGNKAVLTLANGRQISLTDAKSGVLASQGKTAIHKTASGQVVYDIKQSGTGNPSQEIQYNTITTPKGGKWEAVLADGSKVWLDAASSIRFPTAFTGKNRTVEITGQAYLEIIHDAKKPFRVFADGQTIEDIGTHFNINAYTDEAAIKTTLLEGSISVSAGGRKVLLKPGQQALSNSSSPGFKVADVNTEEAIAWKNGYFRFNDENIQGIMRQLARWYNIDVQYEGDITRDGLNGKISRDKNISQVLNMLAETKLVHFKIEGRRITVMQ